MLEALGHPMTNKTLEGYPGNRFHAGGQCVDIVEQAAVDRACELFGCGYANVQPHSGTQANQTVFFALLSPGDRILSMDLAAGGHLSHGARPNISGRWFKAHHYGVDRESGLIDYAGMESLAKEIRPKMIIAGGSAYPRQIDFERFRRAADMAGALLLIDMAHIAGLVAANVHPSPISQADIVTCTTTKTLRGPRGGLILSRDERWRKALQAAVFPGVQGSLHTQVIAAKAVCLGEALAPEFQRYGQQVLTNARVLSDTLDDLGVGILTGGTDTHMLLLDLSSTGLRGLEVERALERIGITTNRNPIPFDVPAPAEWSGLRIGVAAATTRGLGVPEFRQVGQIISDTINDCIAGGSSNTANNLKRVAAICAEYPVY